MRVFHESNTRVRVFKKIDFQLEKIKLGLEFFSENKRQEVKKNKMTLMGLEVRKWTYSLLTVQSCLIKKKKKTQNKTKQNWGLGGEERGADSAENVNERDEEFE